MRSSSFIPIFTLTLSLAPFLTHCQQNARAPALQRRQNIGTGPNDNNNINQQCTDVSCDSYVADEQATIRDLTGEEKAMYKRNNIAYENGANTEGGMYGDNDESYNADGTQRYEEDEVYGPVQPEAEQPQPQQPAQQPQQQQQPAQQQQQQPQEEYTIPGVDGNVGAGPLQCQPLQNTERCQFGSYTVAQGDSPSSIGRRLSVPYLEIVRINNLDPRNLQIGSVMYVLAFLLFSSLSFSVTLNV